MSFQPGGIKLSTNFIANAKIPLDSKSQVEDYTDLVLITDTPSGQITYVINEDLHYKFDGSNWSPFGGGGSGGCACPDYTTAGLVKQLGVVWRNEQVSALAPWDSISYMKGIFVATSKGGSGGNFMMSSVDGVKWKTIPSGISDTWYSITNNGDYFLAFGGAGLTRKSYDGLNWTQYTASGLSVGSPYCAKYAQGKWIVGDTGGKIFSSTDGINFTERIDVGNNQWNSIEYGLDRFVAVANSGTSGNHIAYSTSGLSWTPVTIGGALNQVAYGDGIFLVVDNTTSANFKYSTDGIVWSNLAPPVSGSAFTVIQYAEGYFHTTANKASSPYSERYFWRIKPLNQNFTSSTWEKSEVVFADCNVGAIAYGNGLIVAVGGDYGIVAGSDGVMVTGMMKENFYNSSPTWSIKNLQKKTISASATSETFTYDRAYNNVILTYEDNINLISYSDNGTGTVSAVINIATTGGTMTCMFI